MGVVSLNLPVGPSEPIDFVGRNLQIAEFGFFRAIELLPIIERSREKRENATDIGFDKCARSRDRTIHMALGCEIDQRLTSCFLSSEETRGVSQILPSASSQLPGDFGIEVRFSGCPAISHGIQNDDAMSMRDGFSTKLLPIKPAAPVTSRVFCMTLDVQSCGRRGNSFSAGATP